ncbi:glycoside hydrolase family 31 protein [Kutzneria albida]|nr:glycoside hydrolase family 31 protein [Kutzneria albida]
MGRTISLAVALATAVASCLGLAPVAAASGLSVDRSGYRLDIDRAPFRLTVRHGGQVVLRTASPAIDFDGGTVTNVRSSHYSAGNLVLSLGTTDPARTVQLTIGPGEHRLSLAAQVRPPSAGRLGVHYDLASGGHWYGQGETTRGAQDPIAFQPWPLETGQPLDPAFGPAEYYMTEPFWFTSRGSGLYLLGNGVKDVSLGNRHPGVFDLTELAGGELSATILVRDTAREVFQDYVGIAGKPEKSDAPDYQYREPVWNSWAQFYTAVTQQGFLDWARGIHDAGIPAHTFSLDDGWSAHYGDFTFNAKFPDPHGMVDQVHRLGARFGLWVSLWANPDSANYALAASRGWLLKSKADPAKPCTVQWWNGAAGIVDLANPEANAWYQGQLHQLMTDYGVDGFKFDTRFFDESCAPYRPDLSMADYQRLGAQMADGYDLQGVGIRSHWTGAQRNGFVVREIDKEANFAALGVAVRQLLALSTVGYPFVTSDMIGGSDGQHPDRQVLIRWAQAAAATPLMYASTSPVGFDAQTVQYYRDAVRLHERLTPYILRQRDRALATGEPIMKPLFFEDPQDQAAYTITDEWLLGDGLLVAPVLTEGTSRDVHLGHGAWFDVANHRVVRGDLHDYHAGPGTLPLFVRMGTGDTDSLLAALL